MDTFAKRAKDRRTDLGLNQTQVAKLAGLKQPDVSKIELGKIQQTTEILALARALKCNPDWLATGDGEMLPATATVNLTAPSATLVATATVQNHPLALAVPAQVATNNVASLDHALGSLAAYLAQADDDTRTAAGGLLLALSKQPDNPAMMAALTALLTPSGFAETQRKAA